MYVENLREVPVQLPLPVGDSCAKKCAENNYVTVSFEFSCPATPVLGTSLSRCQSSSGHGYKYILVTMSPTATAGTPLNAHLHKTPPWLLQAVWFCSRSGNVLSIDIIIMILNYCSGNFHFINDDITLLTMDGKAPSCKGAGQFANSLCTCAK